MDFLKGILVSFFTIVFNFIEAIVNNHNISYGLSIIAFTLIIRIFLLPLYVKQIKSQSKTQLIQPEMKKIQEKYKNNPKKSQEELMKLYKEHDANPMSGCLPLIIQMPILFAMYYVFNNLQGIEGVSFLWIKDLSKPDQWHILPLLSMITTYLSSKIIAVKSDDAQAKQMATMYIVMAGVIGYMSLNFKSALVIYWVTGNIIQITQTLIMKKVGIIAHTLEKKVEEEFKEENRQHLIDEQNKGNVKNRKKKR